jgi:hypothetical protein
MMIQKIEKKEIKRSRELTIAGILTNNIEIIANR